MFAHHYKNNNKDVMPLFQQAPVNRLLMTGGRVMTVVCGIPFYLSTGRFSKQPNTWFPHFGKSTTHDGWIIKPRMLQLPRNLADFCNEMNLNRSVRKRLGTVQTMCISAQFNTGFWGSDIGIKLRKFLLEEYADHFPNINLIEQIKTEVAAKKYKTIDNYRLINHCLYQWGSVILLDQVEDFRVFPSKMEIDQYIKRNVNSALLVLSGINVRIPLNTYQTVIALSGIKDLLSFVLQQRILEDDQKVFELNALVEKSRKRITKIKIAELDRLFEIQLQPKYAPLLKQHSALMAVKVLHNERALVPDNLDILLLLDQDLLNKCRPLLCDQAGRNILRILRTNNNLNEGVISVVLDLLSAELFQDFKHQLRSSEICCALQKISETKPIDRDILQLVDFLYGENLLHKYLHLFTEDEYIVALKNLHNASAITPQNVFLVDALIKMNLLKKSQDFLTHKEKIDWLLSAYKSVGGRANALEKLIDEQSKNDVISAQVVASGIAMAVRFFPSESDGNKAFVGNDLLRPKSNQAHRG